MKSQLNNIAIDQLPLKIRELVLLENINRINICILKNKKEHIFFGIISDFAINQEKLIFKAKDITIKKSKENFFNVHLKNNKQKYVHIYTFIAVKKSKLFFIKTYYDNSLVKIYNKKNYINKISYITLLLLNKFDKKFFYLFFLKKITHFSKFKNKYICIDRDYIGNDNAEYFFKYALEKSSDFYFFVKKNTPTYNRLKKINKKHIIGLNKFSWLIASLHSKYIISSNLLGFITLMPLRENYPSLFSSKFCFLQHGTIKDYMPSMNRFIPDIFCTTTLDEYKSIVANDYNYLLDQSIVKIVGQSRFFEANNIEQKENIILLMLTWRNYEVLSTMKNSCKRYYSSTFKKSMYFKKIVDLCKTIQKNINYFDNTYKIKIILHPYIIQQSRDFLDLNLDIVDYEEQIIKQIAISKFIITDFSSIAFDAAYLNKEIIYYHFDYFKFRKDHTYYEGYFSYHKNGFGPIFKHKKDVVAYLINKIYIKKKYHLDDVYKFRKLKTFRYTPNNPNNKIISLIYH